MNNPLDILKPKSIKPGTNVALIAPAGPINEESLIAACKKIESLGFHPKYTKRILEHKGYLAGNDAIRLADLHEAFENSNNDFILCIRGGYGSSRIVDKIDYSLIKRNPKVFIGFSDITVLLNTIWQRTGLVTFHGVVGKSEFTEYTSKLFLEMISFSSSTYKIHSENSQHVNIITEGKAQGRLVGGNLSIINSLLGTPFEIDFTGKIVFIEDIDEPPYKIDRMLTQLLLAGSLQKAAAIILGDFSGCDADNSEKNRGDSLSLSDVFSDRLLNLKIPVIKGFSFGHTNNQAIFPIGITAEIDTSKTYLKLLENVVDK